MNLVSFLKAGIISLIPAFFLVSLKIWNLYICVSDSRHINLAL